MGEVNDCWTWLLNVNSSNYGQLTIYRKTRRAHRTAYIIFHDLSFEDIDGQDVLHSCDNPRCVNPRHLRLGTQQDNMDDMKSRGRWIPKLGSDNANSKLTPEQVLEIRNQIVEGRKRKELAKQFGVCLETISRIHRKEYWAHV